jgi:hypothetical protein
MISIAYIRVYKILRRDFFTHWFTDPPTVNIQKVKNKKMSTILDVNNFTILVNFS